MKGISKFEYGTFYCDFYDKRYFAVSKQKYTLMQARELFESETDHDAEFCQTQGGVVVWRAGAVDGEPRVCWWLEIGCDGTEPRHCPVWVFEY